MGARDFGIATLSLGECSQHKLERKLEAAAKAGFNSVELFVPDWEAFVKEYRLLDAFEEYDSISDEGCLRAAKYLKRILDSLNLSVSCIQPLRDIEGRTNAEERKAGFDQVMRYLPIANALGTQLILLCSSCQPDANPDRNIMSLDLKNLSVQVSNWCHDNKVPQIRLGYEALSWGTHISTWSDAWDIVKRANQPNLGLIFDSFNFLAREYCDPYVRSGLQRSTAASRQFLNDRLRQLVQQVPGDRIYLFQLADAALPPASFKPPTDPTVPRLRPWSRSYRLFPCEGYLPVGEVYDAVLATGYTGPISLEVFNSSLSDPSAETPGEHAQRGFAGLQRISQRHITTETTKTVTTSTRQSVQCYPNLASSPIVAVH